MLPLPLWRLAMVGLLNRGHCRRQVRHSTAQR
jgi:hypothetical protein